LNFDELKTLRDRLVRELERAEADQSPLPRFSAHDRAQRRRLIDQLDQAIARQSTKRQQA